MHITCEYYLDMSRSLLATFAATGAIVETLRTYINN